MAKLRARIILSLSPVSAARANGVARLTGYAATVRSWLAILVALAACNDHGVQSLTKIKAKVCACKTASCAEQAMKLVPQEAIESTHRTQGLARDMLDCLAKLQADEQPTTDPDAEGSAAQGPAAEGSAAEGSAAGGSATGASATGASAARTPSVDPPAAPSSSATPPPARATRTGDPAPAKKP
jgi:hypothetical protein